MFSRLTSDRHPADRHTSRRHASGAVARRAPGALAHRRLRRGLTAVASVAALAGALLTVGTPAPADAAVPDTIPLKITNNSQRGDQVHIYTLGTDLTTGRQGWADAGGVFHAWPAGSVPPVPAPDASIPGPAAGQTTTIRIPRLSGRIYFSYGRKLDFRLATGGLVQPAVQNPSDPNRDILFNWSEFTLDGSGLWLNSTQVDMFSAPYTVGVQRSGGSMVTAGQLKPGGYNGVFSALRAQPGWGGLIQTRSDGTVLRALSPLYGLETGALSSSMMDDYISRVWTKYATTTLTVTPFADRPGTVYSGRVSGGVLRFTDSSGAVVTSFQKPDAASVFGCHKLLDAPNDAVRGPISRTLCAGFNRSTLLTNTHQPDTSSADFYRDPMTNHYARVIHERMADGKAYAFAFDDVGNHESLVHEADPAQAQLTLSPFD